MTSEELAEVKAHLRNGTSPVHPYELLYIVGRSFDTSAKDLVESFLTCPEEPDLSRLALQILCTFWGWTGQYLDYVAEFIVGVPWDPDGAVRGIALSAAGEYLRGHQNKELLGRLLAIVEDQQERMRDKISWEVALESLARAVGYEYREVLGTGWKRDLNEALTHNVLAKAQERLQSGG